LNIVKTAGNQHAQTAQIQLPDSTKISITNVYMPPTRSLNKRNIPEASARQDIEDILTTIPPQQRSIVCGDFNTRTGTLSPTIHDQPTYRHSIDHRRCPRATWLIDLCELHNLYVTNGLQPGPRAEYTCKNNKGRSVIDYILSTEAYTKTHIDSAVLFNIADHSLLYTHIPIHYTGHHPH
jgi:exonuclease III